MNNVNLPPLPPIGTSGTRVCAAIQIYLGIWDDLPSSQQQLISAHLQTCPECAMEMRVLSRATRMVATMEASAPSARVDQAVMAAIAARAHNTRASTVRRGHLSRLPQRRPSLHIAALVGLAAVVVLAVITSAILAAGRQQQAFALPANLSWSSGVLYHTQTMMSTQGEAYKVVSYHNMATDSMNVETTMGNTLDVMMVQDGQKTLGLDMMHHVAQWGESNWSVDESIFDLGRLRGDLRTGSATYLDKDTFKGQDVYRIRYPDGSILLLDMHYMPVNVLQNNTTVHAEKPMYDTLQWLSATGVSSTMWDMQVPAGFKMGQLPTKPAI